MTGSYVPVAAPASQPGEIEIKSNVAISSGRSSWRLLQHAASAIATVLLLSVPFRASAQTFTVDTSAASPLTGLWWNGSESGWGATITQQSGILFVTMFVYDAAGSPVWYTVSCTIAGAGCTGDMVRVRGGSAPTVPWNGTAVRASAVGSMTLTFASNDAGTMAYTLDGTPASRQITRQIFGPPPAPAADLAGTWFGAIIEIRSNCTQSQNNGGHATYGQYDIGKGAGSSGALTIALSGVTGLQCSYGGSFTTNGARLAGSGLMQCSDGRRGAWQSTGMLVTDRAMSLDLAVQLSGSETCTIATTLGGSRP
jgi:hypothetical protein